MKAGARRSKTRTSNLITAAAVTGTLLAIPALSACQTSTAASEVGAKAVENAAPASPSPTPTPSTPLVYPADPPPVATKSASPTPGDNIGSPTQAPPAPKPVAPPPAPKPKPAVVTPPKKPVCVGLNLQLAKDSWSIATSSKRLIAIADVEAKRTQADLKSAEALNDVPRVTSLRTILTQYTEMSAKANANKSTADAMLVRIKAACKLPKGALN